MNPHPPIPAPACPSLPTSGVVPIGHHDLTQTARSSDLLHLPPRMTTAERIEFRAARRAWDDAASAAIVAAVKAVKETYRPGAPISPPADGRPSQMLLSVH